MVKSKADIEHSILKNASLLKGLGARRIGFFGSFVHGTVNAQSDVDVLVEFIPGQKNFSNYTGLYEALSAIFERKVDFLTPESLSPYLAEKILKDVHYVSVH
jgi:predicted nucleotidyltransferase